MKIFVIAADGRVMLLHRCGPTEAAADFNLHLNNEHLDIKSRTYADEPMAVWEPDIVCRKSSSMSRTLASRDLEERSFSSSSFMRLLNSIVLRVILRPGRPIRKIQGSHCRKTDLIWLWMKYGNETGEQRVA